MVWEHTQDVNLLINSVVSSLWSVIVFSVCICRSADNFAIDALQLTAVSQSIASTTKPNGYCLGYIWTHIRSEGLPA